VEIVIIMPLNGIRASLFLLFSMALIVIVANEGVKWACRHPIYSQRSMLNGFNRPT